MINERRCSDEKMSTTEAEGRNDCGGRIDKLA